FGRAVKSYVSKSFCTGKSAFLMRLLSAFAERAATSSSVSRKRYAGWSSLLAAASRASFSNSASMVGSFKCLRLDLSKSALGSGMGISLAEQLVEAAQVRHGHLHRQKRGNGGRRLI